MRLFPIVLTVAVLAAGSVGGAGCGRRASVPPFQAGIAAMQKGDWAAAAKAFEDVVKDRPDHASANCHLGIAYWKQGRLELAAESFKRAASLAPTDPQPLEYLGCVYMRMERWVEAGEALDGASRRAPKLARIYTQWGLVQMKASGPDAAREYFLFALGREPLYGPALYNMAVLNRDAYHDAAEATRYFQRFLEVGGSPEYVKEARRSLKELAAAPPGDAVGKARAGSPESPEAGRAAAGTGSAGGKTPPVPAIMPKLVFRKPAKPDTRMAVDAFERGAGYQRASDWNRAIYHYTRAIESDDTYLNAYYNLGLVYQATKAREQARDCFVYALRLKPDMVNTRYNLALVLRDMGQERAAVDELSAALQIDPNYADAHLVLGVIYQSHPDKLTDTRRHFSRYLELAPNGQAAKDARRWLEYNRAR